MAGHIVELSALEYDSKKKAKKGEKLCSEGSQLNCPLFALLFVLVWFYIVSKQKH